METMTTASAGLAVDRDGDVTRVTLNRPEKRNALSRNLLAELETEV